MTAIAKSGYEIGRDNIRFCGLDIHNPVFVVSSLTVMGFVAGVLAFREVAAFVFGALRVWLTSTFDWVLMGAGNLFVLFCLLLVLAPVGGVRLGGAGGAAGVFRRRLVCHAVRGGDGHRPDVLRGGGAGRALPAAAARHRRDGPGGGAPHRSGRRHLPLGRASVGRFRRCRPRARLRLLQPRVAADPALGVLSAAGRGGVGARRPRHRHAGRRGHALRAGHLRSVSAPSRRRPDWPACSAFPPPTRSRCC